MTPDGAQITEVDPQSEAPGPQTAILPAFKTESAGVRSPVWRPVVFGTLSDNDINFKDEGGLQTDDNELLELV